MKALDMTRRSFVKLSAIVGAAAALSGSGSTAALAESREAEAKAGETKRIRTGCRGCGKYECGVFVTVQDGKVVKIEGDNSYVGSMGNCCNKSQSSIQACYHPDRLKYPVKRTNPKGEAPGWVRISWDEALELCVSKFGELQDKYGGACLSFMGGTSRIYAMSGMSAMAYLYDSPNIVSPVQVCKGPRNYVTGATVGPDNYFVENVWGIKKNFVQWGSGIEVSNYDDAGRVAVDNANWAECYINVDPRMSNLAKEATHYMPVRPATDGALLMSWYKLAMEEGLYQDNYVRRWTDLPFLVCEDVEPSGWSDTIPKVSRMGVVSSARNVKTILLKESDLKEDGDPKKFIVYDEANKRFTYLNAETGLWEGEGDEFVCKYTDWDYVQRAGELSTKYKWEKAKGKYVHAYREGISDLFLPDESPMPTVEGCEYPTKPCLWSEGVIPEVTLKDGRTVKVRTAWDYLYDNVKEFTFEKAEEITGVRAEVNESAARNYMVYDEDNIGDGCINFSVTNEHTGNAIKLIHCYDSLDAILGRRDTPGGHRGMTRVPSIYEYQYSLFVGQFLRVGTKNSVTDPVQKARRICDFPMYPNADATQLYYAMKTGEPYQVRGCLTQAGGMLNQTNLNLTWEGVKNLDFFVNWNLWHDPISDLADVILPEAHWMEQECSRVAQGSGGYYGAHIKCIEPPAECKWGPDIVNEWYKLQGTPFWGDRTDGGDMWEGGDYLRSRAIASLGMEGGWQEFREGFLKNGWYDARKTNPDGFGSARRYETGWLDLPFVGKPGFYTPTTRDEVWSITMETSMREKTRMDTGEKFGWTYALPYFVEPKSSPVASGFRDVQSKNMDNPNHEYYEQYTPENYPYIASTGRRIPVYFHSEHRQLPWCREVWPVPRMEINPKDANDLGLEQGDWAWIETPFYKIRQCVEVSPCVAEGRVNLEHTWWFPEMKRPGKGFDLCGCNCLVDAWAQCEAEGAPQLRGYLVNIYKATAENSPFGNPVPCDDDGTEIITSATDPRLKAWGELNYERENY